MTAKLAAYWNIAVISPVCADQQFLDKKVCFNVYNEHTYFLKCTLLSVAEWLFLLAPLNSGLSDLNKSVWTFYETKALFVEIVSGYVCNHGSPSGERDTASPRGRYGERPQRDSV